jgi:putative phosphoribosyl transferase
MKFHQLQTHPFRNRVDAGRQLSQQLLPTYYRYPNGLVLALPRGGVPVAHEIACALDLPLDICLVRKLGVPDHPELAMGAIAANGVRVLNHDLVERLAISSPVIEQVTAAETAELQRRQRAYLGDRPELERFDKTVILVDDGIATGASLRAAISVLHQSHVRAIVVAVPVAQPSILADLRSEVAEVVCVVTPQRLQSISLWYDEFDQTSDETVTHLLSQHRESS